jgi:hypothetical protein
VHSCQGRLENETAAWLWHRAKDFGWQKIGNARLCKGCVKKYWRAVAELDESMRAR